MNTQKVRDLANTALAGFEDLSLECAVEIALWNLCDILADVTDDPASIALIGRIEARLEDKGLAFNKKYNYEPF